MAGYGVPISGRVILRDIILEADLEDGFVYYKRISGGETIVSRKIYGLSHIKLLPLYPVNTPVFLTNYVLLKFTSQIDISPGEEVLFYAKMPVEVAVYVFKESGNKSVFNVIDVFSLSKVKYCLYGPVDKGVIARYYVSETYDKEIDPELGEAVVRVVVKNKTSEWVVLSKILLETNLLTLAYVRGTWNAYTQEIIVYIDSPKTASIQYGNLFKENLEKTPDLPYFKQPVIHSKTTMMWGI